MTQRSPFRWHTSWNGIVLSDNLLIPNTWTLTLDYNIITDEMFFKDIGMQRLDFMVGNRFENSLMLDYNSDWNSEFYDRLGTYMITLPDEPYDSLIAAVAILKASAVTKDVFEIHGASIVSRLGYNVENYVTFADTEDMMDVVIPGDVAPWYLRDDAGFTDIMHTVDDLPVITRDTERWDTYELNWDYHHAAEAAPGVHPKTAAPKRQTWTPIIVKGGQRDDED